LAAAFGVAVAFMFAACGKGKDVKLLESITDGEGNVLKRFEYDKQNRIVKINDETITYADNLITVGNQKFAIKDSTVTVGKETLIINKEGYLVSRKDPDRTGYDYVKKQDRFKPVAYLEEYKYEDGNLIKESDNNGDGENFAGSFRGYEYDGKPSPFSNCNTPKWLLKYLLGDVYVLSVQGYGSKNNVIEADFGGGDYYTRTVYKYEYDHDGFPTKLTIKLAEDYESDDLAGISGTVIRYIYRGEPQTAPAKTETSESKESGGKECDKEGSPITIEAVYLKGLLDEYKYFRLTNGEEIELRGEPVNDNLKECDKVSVTYKMAQMTDEAGCMDIKSFISVRKIGTGVKLLETIADENGNIKKRFDYDKQNRIAKISNYWNKQVSETQTIAYGNNSVTAETSYLLSPNTPNKIEKFAINGKTVTKDGESFTINGDGYIVDGRDGSRSYEYKNGNLIKQTYPNPADDVPPMYVHNIDKYDGKKSPFSDSKTPKWLLQMLDVGIYNISKNNVLEEIVHGRGTTTTVYKYEYDSDGFPVTATDTAKYGDDENGTQTTTRYTYSCGQ